MDDFRIRRALPGDGHAMCDITRAVWDGDDYVPFVWSRWLADSKGYLMVAEESDGRVVGLQHIEVQPDGTAWVEGIRVAEAARNRGVARCLLEAGVHWAQAHHCTRLRLSTTSENPASNRVAEHAGFRMVGRFPSVHGPAQRIGIDDSRVRVAAAAEFGTVTRFLANALALPPSRWVYTEGWTALTLNDERIRLLLAVHAIVVRGQGSFDALAIATSSTDRPALKLGLLCGTEDGMAAICAWLRAQAYVTGLPAVRATVAANVAAERALASAGFESQHGHIMILHEHDRSADNVRV